MNNVVLKHGFYALITSSFFASICHADFIPSVQKLDGIYGLGFYASSISSDGSTIVGNSTSAYAYTASYFKNNQYVDLGWGEISSANHVSFDGSVISGHSNLKQEVYQCKNGTTVKINVPEGYYGSQINTMSNDGNVLYGFYRDNIVQNTYSFRWDNGTFENIGEYVWVYGSSFDGSIYVGEDNSIFKRDALGNNLSLSLGGATSITAISNDGTVIAGTSYMAIHYAKNDVVQYISAPSGSTYFAALSADGNFILGNSSNQGVFLWNEQSGYLFLSDILAENGLDQQIAEWTNIYARDFSVNNDIVTIIGQAYDENNKQFSWMTTFALNSLIPEPSSYACILGLTALAGTMLRRRRK